MFYTSLQDLPSGIREAWQRSFAFFNSQRTVLPLWNVRFFGYIMNEKDLEEYRIGSIGAFRYYNTKNAYWIFSTVQDHCVAVKLSTDYTNVDVYFNEEYDSLYEQIHELLCLAYQYRCVCENGLLLHSSAVSYLNNGILFMGNSSAGKSTQAEMWKKYMNARVLNYDRNYVYKEHDKYWVSSTPWGGKEEYYINETTELKALVFVQKWLGENRVEFLEKGDGFSVVYLHNYLYPLNRHIEDAFIQQLSSLTAAVPVYKLYCTKSRDAVDVLSEALFD